MKINKNKKESLKQADIIIINRNDNTDLTNIVTRTKLENKKWNTPATETKEKINP